MFDDYLVVSQSGNKYYSYCPDRVAATDHEPTLDCNFEESCKLTPEQSLVAIQSTQNKKEQNFALECRGKHQRCLSNFAAKNVLNAFEN